LGKIIRQGPRARASTIKDVAREIGFAPSTVARALADNPRISSETKELVRKTAERLDYVPNSAARVMRGGLSTLIGLVIPDIQNDFYSSIAKTLSQVFERSGMQLVLSISADNPTLERAIVESLISARAAGIIIVPTAAPDSRTVELLSRTAHVQLLRRVRGLPGDWFGIEDKAGIHAAARHLLSLGHTQIGYIGGVTGLTTGADRLAGFKTALAEFKVKVPREFIETVEPTAVAGRDAMVRLLHLENRPTAIVMASVGGTLGALLACRMRNLSTPKHLSLVGYGDAPGFQWWGRGLTTIGLPIDSIANDCAEWLIGRLTRKERSSGNQEALYACSLIVRESTSTFK
jgi:DNA-binding LacI/PurR family transcriptional regulator